MARFAFTAAAGLVACSSADHDQRLDMAIPDMSELDGAPDLTSVDAEDLASPDLEPMCAAAADCMDVAMPVCDHDAGVCRACQAAADDGQCDSHVSGQLCLTEGTNQGRCGICRPADDSAANGNHCGAATPVCTTDGNCKKCQAHSECPSQVCNLDGSCADPSTVAYADNTNSAMVTCSNTPHTSTPSAPYCEIQTAIDNLGAKTIVRVYPSATAYGLLTISAGTVSIVGSPATAATCAASGACVKVSGDASNPAISISGVSTVVSFDGIEVTAGGLGQDGLFCSQASIGPTVTLRRSYVHGVGGTGVNATKCKVTLDQTQIGPGNSGGAIALSGAQYSISNNFVVGNATTTKPAIILDGTELPGGLGFRNNTVIKNGNLGGVGGVACNTGTMDLRESIIWQNSMSNTGGAGTCNLVNTVTTPSPDPTFVNSAGPDYDAHLTGRDAANLACCIDKVPSSPVDHDYDGRSRPQPSPGQWDIGAHEVP
jgi:hypothetical protein